MSLDALKKFALGFSAPSRGLRLIRQSARVRRWAIAPFLIAVVIFVSGLIGALPFLNDWLPIAAARVTRALGLVTGSSFETLATWLFLIITWPVALACLLSFLLLIVKLVAIPFVGVLAESVLNEFGVLPPSRVGIRAWLGSNAGVLRDTLIITFSLACLGLLLLIFSLVPGLGIFTFFSFLLIAAFEVADPALEALQMGFAERMRFFKAHFPAFFGIACAMGLVFLIPGLNFLLFPIFVVGATDVVHRLNATADRQRVING